MDVETARDICLSQPEATESVHFEKIAFKVSGKIFGTLSPEEATMVLKLPLEKQAELCAEQTACQPVNGSWGNKGWTTVRLAKTSSTEQFKMWVRTAWATVAPKRLRDSIQLK